METGNLGVLVLLLPLIGHLSLVGHLIFVQLDLRILEEEFLHEVEHLPNVVLRPSKVGILLD